MSPLPELLASFEKSCGLCAPPKCPSRQALAPGSLPLGKGTQAKSKQASHGICSLSSLTKCPAGHGPATREEGMEIESEEKRGRREGERGAELEMKRQEGEKGRDPEADRDG